MKKRSQVRRKTIAAKSHKARQHRCTSTALLVLDQRPFLKKALSKCKRLRNELHKKQQQLSDFEENDQSAYQQWLHRKHGRKLSQIRELEQETEQYSFILNNLSSCLFFYPDKLIEVHQELFELKSKGRLHEFSPHKYAQNNEDDFDEDEDDFDEDEDDFDEDEDDFNEDDCQSQWDDEIDEDAKAFFDRMFGFMGGDSAHANHDDFEINISSTRKPISDPGLKNCYRALAKRLHPDHSTLDEALREKRWHEMQEAYQNHDLEGLLRVEAICDMDETGLSIQLGLARLNELTYYHQSHLKPIRLALREAKRTIAFGFSQASASKQIKAQVASELSDTLDQLHFQIKQMRRDADDMLAEFIDAQNEDALTQEIPEDKSNDRLFSPSKQPRPTSPNRNKAHVAQVDPRQMTFF